MKIDIKCYEFLTNKGNGKKCILGPKDCKQLPDCVFKTNGMNPLSTAKQKKTYLTSLAIVCKQWHERKNETNHFFAEICPQLERICEQFEKKLIKK
jgi:hypothetical protein